MNNPMTSYFLKIGIPVEMLDEMNENLRDLESLDDIEKDDETFHTEGEF